jgi:hypothetical protein
MFDGLDGLDKILLAIAFFCSVSISCEDLRTRKFSVSPLLGLATMGVAWCIKQSFIPVALIPIGCGMAILVAVNHFWKQVISEGDMLLFLVTGLFIPICLLSEFMILCGVNGLIIGAVMKTRNIPLALAILLSAAIVFGVYIC